MVPVVGLIKFTSDNHIFKIVYGSFHAKETGTFHNAYRGSSYVRIQLVKFVQNTNLLTKIISELDARPSHPRIVCNIFHSRNKRFDKLNITDCCLLCWMLWGHIRL